jgi:hypothetical protein
MDEVMVTPANDPELWKFMIENGVSFLIVVILFVFVLVWLIRRFLASQERQAHASAQALMESTRLQGRVTYDLSKSIRAQTNQTRLGNTRIAAMIEVLRSQPAQYALQKHKALNGGYTDQELDDMRRRVRHAEESIEDAAEWNTDEAMNSHDPDETIEEKITRLELKASLASTEERANELLMRAKILREEMGIEREDDPIA